MSVVLLTDNFSGTDALCPVMLIDKLSTVAVASVTIADPSGLYIETVQEEGTKDGTAVTVAGSLFRN
jgi:hypothetical protein